MPQDQDAQSDSQHSMTRADGQSPRQSPVRGDFTIGDPHEPVPGPPNNVPNQQIRLIDHAITIDGLGEAMTDPPRPAVMPGQANAWIGMDFLAFLDAMDVPARQRPAIDDSQTILALPLEAYPGWALMVDVIHQQVVDVRVIRQPGEAESATGPDVE